MVQKLSLKSIDLTSDSLDTSKKVEGGTVVWVWGDGEEGNRLELLLISTLLS